MPIAAILIWLILLGATAAVYIQKIRGKNKYRNVTFHNDPEWIRHSQNRYPEQKEKKYYYFHPDKQFLNQGNILEDEDRHIVYEEKVLYNNGIQADETDFVNHIISYTHHHRVGKPTTLQFGYEEQGIFYRSTMTFDGEDIFEYLKEKGYDYRFHIRGLAYWIDITRNAVPAGTIYSSDNGKNLYERNGKSVEAKAGSKGLLVLECRYSDLDALFLYAVAFSNVEFDLSMLKHAGE